MRRWILILGPLAFGLLALTLIAQVARPRAEAWVLSNIERLSRAHLPVVIRAERFHLSLFLPKAEFVNLTVTPKPELGMGDLRIEIDSAVANLDLIQLLAGRLGLSAVVVTGLVTDVNVDPFLETESKPEPIDWTPVFRLLRQTPVSRIALIESNLFLHSSRRKIEADLIDFDLLLVNGQERLQARLDVKDAELTAGELSAPFRFQTDAVLSPQGLDVTDLRLMGLGTLLTAKASFKNLPFLLITPEGSVHFDFKASLPQVGQFLKKLRSAPRLEGALEAKGNLEVSQGSIMNGGFRLFGHRLKFDDFDLGQIETEGRVLDDVLKIPHVKLTHAAGMADLRDFELQMARERGRLSAARVKGRVSSGSIDMHRLLLALDVGDVPLDLLVRGDFACDGPVWPVPAVACEGEGHGEKLEVRSGNRRGDAVIVRVPGFSVRGRVEIDDEKVAYDTRVFAGKDEGRSSGTVSYEKGFDIEYSTPRLHMANIAHLAGLRLEGSARIQGKTSGGSRAATFQMQAEGTDIVFEEFELGRPQALIRYEKGSLHFENIAGQLGQTEYAGGLTVDLVNDRLEADLRSPRAEISDLVRAIHRRLPIPVEITGSGEASARISGPLRVNLLTYDARARFNRVAVLGEVFDQVVFRARAVDGEFEIDEAFVAKGKHRVVMTGTGHPTGQIRFLVQGKDLPLEQSENISLLNSNITGLLNFSLEMTEDIRSPQFHLKANARSILVEDQEIPETDASILMNKDEMKGEANLVGGKLKSKFQIPFREDRPFSFEAQVLDWNFTSIFALLGAGPLLSEYQSSVTGTLDLRSEQGGFWKSSGRGLVDKVFLKRGALSLENKQPIEVMVRGGSFSVESFALSGPATAIEIAGRNNTRERLDLRIKAETELRLFQIFLPFLEELSGKAGMSMTLGGSLDQPELLGAAKTDGGFVKIRGFPHPFEKITTDVQFSQSRVLINQMRGELAGGTFDGEGSILIQGPRDLPTQINARISNVSLNVPDQVRTNGSGEVIFRGNWFPFTLSGIYRVQGGLVSKEFTDDSLQNSIKRSSYLPKMILQRAFEPVLLDLEVALDNPLPVRNSMVEGSVTGRLQVRGPPASPVLFGQLSAEKATKFFFRDKVFDVITGNVKFTDPKEINPELYVSARTRVEEYDINLLVQGTAKAPLIRMTSLPPLSDQDIVSLLALGVTSQSVDKRLQNRDQESSSGGYQIGTAVLQQISIFQKAQKATGFNVQFSSNYDDTKNVEVRKIIISRQLSEKLKVSATSFVDEQASREFKVEYSLNPSVSAIGSFQQRANDERSQLGNDNAGQTESILGLDLEYKKEFR